MVMYKKITFIILVAFTVMFSLIYMMNETTFAATSYAPQSIKDRASKRSQADVIVSCFRAGIGQGGKDGGSSGHYQRVNANERAATDNGHGLFFNGNTHYVNLGVSEYDSKGDNNNQMECSSLSVDTFVKAMNSFGFSGDSPQKILCPLGVIENDADTGKTKDQQCNESGQLYVNVNNLSPKIIDKVGSLDNVDKYYITYTLMTRSGDNYCGATYKGTEADYQAGKFGGNVYPIYLFNQDGSGTTHRYTFAHTDNKLNLWNQDNGNPFTSEATQCNNLANNSMGWGEYPWVSAYAAYLKSLATAASTASSGKSSSATSGSKEYAEACKALGYSSSKELEACAEGFRHLSSPDFCATKYESSPEELAACKAAQASRSAATPSEGADEEDQENCKIDYVGWIVCPVVNILAQMSDEAQEQLEKFLVVNNNDIRDNAYEYWTKIRDYANIIFVIAFLYVIYSQLTGYGIDNYGIKRMLPKLIMGIILVNVSFHLCLLLIDISNVVGSSAYKFISSVEISGGADAPSGSWVSKGNWATGIATLALGATIGFFALSAVIAGLVFILIVALTTIFMLGMRQAILILCVVISPLAFAAMLLPNAESLFKKWWSALKACLFLYPIVGILFGASSLAASILSKGSDGDVIKQLLVALLQIAPLLLVKKLIDAAMNIGGLSSAIGKMQGKVHGFVNDKAQSRLSKGLYGQWRSHRDEKNKLRRAQIQGGTYRGRGGFVNPRNWRSGANRGLNAITGDFGQKRKLTGSAAVLAEDKERMKAANAWIADNNMSSDRLTEIATGIDKDGNKVDLKGISSYQRRAAMQALAPHMTSEQAANLATASASFGDASLQKEAADAIAQSGAKKAPWVGGKQLEAIRQGTYNEQEAMSDYIQNKASGQGLANADANAVNKMVKFAENEAQHNADNSYMQSLMRARADLEADPKTAGGISSAVRQEIERIPPMQRQSNSGGGRNQGSGSGSGSGSGGGGGNPTPRGSTPRPNGGGGVPPNPGGSGGSDSDGGNPTPRGSTPRPNGGGGVPPNPGGSGGSGGSGGGHDSHNSSSGRPDHQSGTDSHGDSDGSSSNNSSENPTTDA